MSVEVQGAQSANPRTGAVRVAPPCKTFTHAVGCLYSNAPLLVRYMYVMLMQGVSYREGRVVPSTVLRAIQPRAGAVVRGVCIEGREEATHYT